MTKCVLRNGTTVEIKPYDDSFADSLAGNLFQGVSVETIIQQRADLLASGPEEVYSVCVIFNSEVVGVCTGVRKRWFGERHRIEMVQVVVKDDFHGQGIARLMMTEIAKHFKKYEVEIVQISAESTNAIAIAAYERIGFVRYGILKNGLRHGGTYSDEIMMSVRCSDLIKEQ
ncbi:MAG: GNAT family protein [Candidatus Thorarchaeota archaeon]|nr:GNAT family protein [Candidatus Thorarchaeota archaeon]